VVVRVFTGQVSGVADPMVCASCGRRVVADEQPQVRMTWACGVESGRPVWACDRCSREHLRSVEGKLDPAWW